MLVSVKARSIGMVMRNTWRGVGSTFYLYWDTLTILRLRMYMYQKLFCVYDPSSPDSITSLTFPCHSCCQSPLSRRSSHWFTPGRLTPRLHSPCLANPIESCVTATLPGNSLEWLFVLSLGQQKTSTNGEEKGRLAKR